MRSILVPLLVFALLFSGCAGPAPAYTHPTRLSMPAGAAIVVPSFSTGDAWSEKVRRHTEDGPVMALADTVVQAGPVDVFDAYGQLVPGYELFTRTTFESAPDYNYDSSMTIEASRGTWLKLHDRIFEGHPMTSTLSVLIWSYTCHYKPTPGRSVFFPEAPTGVDTGTPRGKTVRVGDVFEQKEELSFAGFSLNTTHTFRALERLDWTLASGLVPAMKFEHVQEYRAGENTGKRITQEVWGHDIPVALEVFHVEDGIQQSLVSFKGGAKPLVYDPKHPEAQYTGVHKYSDPKILGRGPDSEGHGIEFPLGQAIALAETSPMTPTLVLWLHLHPDAYAVQATHYRDVGNRSYLWEIYFTDGKEMMIAQVERKVAVEGQIVETVNTPTLVPIGSSFFPLPARVRETAIVEAKLGFDTAFAFLPNAENWNVFRWQIYEFKALGKVLASYSLGTGTQRSDTVAPLIKGTMKGAGMMQYVDAFTGRIGSGTGAHMTCSMGISP